MLILLLSACTDFLAPRAATTEPAAATGTATAPARSTASPAVTPTPRVLRIWLPEQFDPNANTAAARLLKERLDSFGRLHPDIILDVRIKDSTGPASLLDMLSLAGVAAPDTLPDLVALSRNEMEDAAIKGIIHPIEGLTRGLDDSRWYSYARQLAHVQNSAYGLPFAGDALVLAYDPAQFANPPDNWDVILRRPGVLAISGDESQVLFLISLYRSMNGGLLDAQNRPMLEEFALEPALTVLERARINNSTSVASEEAAWRRLLDREAAWMVTSVTSALAEPSQVFEVAPLAGLNGDPFTLATSWTWALAGSRTENEPLAMELAEWLVEDVFLQSWVNEAGYLSTRSSDISQRFPALSVAGETAQPLPANDLLAALTPVLQDSAIRILNGEAVDTVAQQAVQSLK